MDKKFNVACNQVVVRGMKRLGRCWYRKKKISFGLETVTLPCIRRHRITLSLTTYLLQHARVLFLFTYSLINI